ncbi:MAG: glycosyltransferase [Patescibacteria group bacterium]
MKNKKVLILFGSPGMGHFTAAQAVKEAFERKYPEVEIRVVDISEFSNIIFNRGYPYLYNNVVFKTPLLFRWAYDFFEKRTPQSILNQIFYLFLIKKKKFISFIKDFSPDFILSTHPLPSQIISLTKQKHLIKILSANICTDFGPHYLWHNLDVNYYFVANDKIKNYLTDHAIDLGKIKVTGIPVRQKFTENHNVKKILDNLHFDGSFPVFLIVGGQIAHEELLNIILKIKEKDQKAQFIIVSGRDGKLQNSLKNSVLRNDSSIKIFGLVDNMQELMAVSDLILSKTGGSTMAECLVKGLPMIVNKVIPGQEEDNVDYLVKNGAGIKASKTEEVAGIVIDLFSHREKLALMKENCRKIAKPNATIDIADFVVSLF